MEQILITPTIPAEEVPFDLDAGIPDFLVRNADGTLAMPHGEITEEACLPEDPDEEPSVH
jgi:hypothetical protein